ncbi:MAG: glycosyltransferase [Acidimicrobiales bacterium]
MPGAEGRVRLVVLNHNGGELLERCFAALSAVDWPADQPELVLVDNASSDGSVEAVVERFPDVRVIHSPTNAGFPANNLALRDLAGVRYVGLVNNDAFVEPGWVRAMVEALDADAGLGAATGRLVFAPRFVDLELTSPARAPGWRDGRALGVRVSGLRVGGEDRWPSTQVVDGAWGPEPDEQAGVAYWTSDHATVRVPVETGETSKLGETGELAVQVRLAAPEPRRVTLDGGCDPCSVEVGTTSAWFAVPVTGVPFDVVNNAGGVVFDDGYGADRGYLEVDRGQYDEPAEVFAWCGGGVMLRPSYLVQVGLFEESFFLYYEDTDLSWRGRAQGWRYRYEPAAIARHVHSASSGVGSVVFMHHTERNRLLMLVRNAPWRLALRAVVRFLLVTASYLWRDVVVPTLRPGSTPRTSSPATVRRRLGAFTQFVRMLPVTLRQRRQLRRRQTVPDDEIARWLTDRTSPDRTPAG